MTSIIRSWCRYSSTTASRRIRMPYKVQRTKNRQLPVYSKTRYGNKPVTIVRRLVGSEDALVMDLQHLLKTSVKVEGENLSSKQHGGPVEIKRYRGRLEIKGHHVHKVKRYFEKLGF